MLFSAPIDRLQIMMSLLSSSSCLREPTQHTPQLTTLASTDSLQVQDPSLQTSQPPRPGQLC